MNKFFLLNIILIWSFSMESRGQQESQQDTTYQFEDIYTYALNGDVAKALMILENINNDSLTEKQKDIKNNYNLRFSSENEPDTIFKKHPAVSKIIKYFKSYWKDVMLNRKPVSEADTLLNNKLTKYLLDNYDAVADLAFHEVRDNLYQHINDYLKQQGYFSNAMGKTGHLYDLYLWQNEEVKNYEVTLPEESVKVTVNFMKDFLSTGWAHFATFGRSYSGGWATNEVLYCVDDAYDQSSESFKVSYLSHEAQHFADYKAFPKLRQADLEYRAKMAELSKASETIYTILKNFMANIRKDENYAHAFANYCVVRDLSKSLFNSSFNADLEDWKKIPVDKINQISVELLKKHTQALEEKGSDLVIGLIK